MTDRFPQLLTADTGIAGAVDDYVVATVTLPRADIALSRGRRSVYEIIKVWFYLGVENLGDDAVFDFAYLSTTKLRSSGDTASSTTYGVDIADPAVFAVVAYNTAVTTSGSTDRMEPQCIDLTDDAGNGFLVATDRIFLTGGNAAGATPSRYVAKILYRIVSVPALEFVGIVQSQISGTT